MNTKCHKKFLIGGVIASLTLLPSCALLDMFKSQSDDTAVSSSMERSESSSAGAMTGDVIVTMNGNPIITSDTIAIEKENVMKSKPEYRAALSFMDPKVLDRNLAEGLVGQIVVDNYVAEKGLDKTSEYQQELAEITKNMKRILNAKFFSQEFPVTVTDADVKSFYETNKIAIPELTLSQGGVAASGIEFSSEADARAFINSVRASNNNFARAVQQEGLTAEVKDFKVVNNQSVGMDPVLRDKIVAMKTVPSVEMVKTDSAVWVVNALSKEAVKYVPLEQVQANIRMLLENNKRNEQIETQINKLRDQYKIVINEDYFKGDNGAQEMMVEEMDMPASGDVAQNNSNYEDSSSEHLA